MTSCGIGRKSFTLKEMNNKQWQIVLTFLGLGFASAVLSIIFMSIFPDRFWADWADSIFFLFLSPVLNDWIPGAIFGFLISLYFIFIQKKPFYKLLIFVLISGPSCSLMVLLMQPGGGVGHLFALVAGLFASFALTIGLRLLFLPLTKRHFFLLSLLGLVLFWHFSIFQVGMAGVLGWIVDKNNTSKQKQLKRK